MHVPQPEWESRRRLPNQGLRSVLGTLILLVSLGIRPIPAAQGQTVVRFKEPATRAYVLLPAPATARLSTGVDSWIEARRPDEAVASLQFGAKIILQLNANEDTPPPHLLADLAVRLVQRVAPGLFVLQAPSPIQAIEIATQLATDPAVRYCRPETRRRASRHRPVPFAPAPNDTLFTSQWHLENRDPSTGRPLGADLNARQAWTITRGEGVLVAVADDGVEYTHPDLAPRAEGTPHFSFVSHQTNGLPVDAFQIHATAVAGLLVAETGNKRGITGVAPKAKLASWVIFGQNDFLVGETSLAEMFDHRSDIVSIQNHSWGNASVRQLSPSPVEYVALSNAFTLGRGGRGIVSIHAAGNGREDGNNVNDDAYAADPRRIAVGAVRSDGRVASYSTPGAAVLVTAPSGDDEEGFANLTTTDRQGSLGYNRITTGQVDSGDYASGAVGFSGTSAATPLVSGVAALILSVNPALHVRDVQQILLHSARHMDLADPGVVTNGAGMVVSHNVGFGVVDSGEAVRLARLWTPRPQATIVTVANTNLLEIADAGLRVVVTGQDIPERVKSLVGKPSLGVHPDRPTASLPVADVGLALDSIATNLAGKGALASRGTNFFRDKIDLMAQAGASFAIIYNNVGGDARLTMAATDFSPIPAVLISQNDGLALRNVLATNPTARVQIRTESSVLGFEITNSLRCEHVTVRIKTDHQARGDLRITLVSPSGTRSVLQHLSQDRNSDLLDWTYTSVQHFYEPSRGLWRLYLTDEEPEAAGSLLEAELSIVGVPISDEDNDGLEDGWERSHFAGLVQSPADDPDHDGYNNAREQVLGTDPNVGNDTFELTLAPWNDRLLRVSWPARSGISFDVLSRRDLSPQAAVLGRVPGGMRESEWFLDSRSGQRELLQVRESASPALSP